MRYWLLGWVLLLHSSFLLAKSYVYERPKDTTPKLAIIIDDIGYNIPMGQRAVAIKAPITLAVLPHTPGSEMLAKAGFASGKQIMLHAPMSNLSQKELGPGALTVGMNKQDFLRVLRSNIRSIPHISGVNNHMGSELTALNEPMIWLMQELQQQQLFFIDSLTNGKSVALKQARAHHIVSAKRDIFLDNVQNEAAIEKMLLDAIYLARQNGYAIAIGHPYPQTMAVLERYANQFIKYGVLLVSVSDILLINTNAYD